MLNVKIVKRVLCVILMSKFKVDLSRGHATKMAWLSQLEILKSSSILYYSCVKVSHLTKLFPQLEQKNLM